MTVNPFNHIDLRVSSMAEAMRFYAALLPRLGFTRERQGAQWKVFGAEGEFPSVPYFGFTEQAGHRPNETRIAFWVGSAQEVDRLADVVRAAGGRNVSGPRPCPEYSPTYYAVFFEDPSGNRLEICFREN
ncbi:MAG TPA: VOC family protein [Candidatus Polarisedimenticolia bacterium]|nr:VOC family protein [Candidatus Polarisedimenticolia bacterium]